MDGSRDNSNYALEQLRVLLVAAHMAKNEKLPTERELSQTLCVSRRAIRRALEVLEAEGSVWRRQGAGTFVGNGPDDFAGRVGDMLADTDFLEVMEVRLRIEPQLAQLAALRAKPNDIYRMRELAEKIRKSSVEDADACELWDGALHRLIAQSAGNKFFLGIFDVVNCVRQSDLWRNVREAARSGSGVSMTVVQHAAIIDAIEARDTIAAGEAMLQHLLSIQENLIRRTSMAGANSPPVVMEA